jgi:hypothetical protein
LRQYQCYTPLCDLTAYPAFVLKPQLFWQWPIAEVAAVVSENGDTIFLITVKQKLCSKRIYTNVTV